MDKGVVSDRIADPKTYADFDEYHALFSRLRREEPVRWTEPAGYRPFWTVSRYNDVLEVEKQQNLFISAPRTVLRPIEQEENIRKVTGSTQVARTLIQMDEPDHRLYRALTQAWFMPGRLRDLHESMEQLAALFIERMEGYNGHCDFVENIAVWYPLHAVMLILGVPEEDEPLMLRLTRQHFQPSDPSVSKGKEYNAASAAKELFEYFSELTAQRRKDPRNDIVSLLADAKVNGEPISEFDRNSYFFVLAVAGHDTTSASIAGLLQALIEHPDQLARLKADPSLLDSAIDEGIRWTSPVRHFFRTATQDYELGGQKIRAGDSLMVCYPSANFDDTVFDDPFEFRIDRKPNRQIAFGFGAHNCLGQHLAKLEMRALFGRLLPRLDSIELAGRPEGLEANFVGGLRSLPISYQMRPLASA
ncbi:cytochrome P450 [Streptomyces fuscichromogenes]|uniref:cytochrome P450 n=1 Tax=Streptomyces fuscichromogenes TaxID=1324013 RepID=UPI003820E89C